MTEPHVHRWVLEAIKRFDVPGECACGEKRVFSGGEKDPSWAYVKAKHSIFAKQDPSYMERI